jgi:hypothetical protein
MNSAIAQMQSDIVSGVPHPIVLKYAYEHIKALRAIPVSERGSAVEETLAFIQSNTDEVEMGRVEFANLALRILNQRGTMIHGDHVFEDHIVRIEKINGTLYVNWQANNNPTTMVKMTEEDITGDDVFRHHGEHIYISKHMQELVD